jgi:hypothetical protein
VASWKRRARSDVFSVDGKGLVIFVIADDDVDALVAVAASVTGGPNRVGVCIPLHCFFGDFLVLALFLGYRWRLGGGQASDSLDDVHLIVCRGARRWRSRYRPPMLLLWGVRIFCIYSL